MQKTLIVAGLIIAAIGLAWPWLSNIPLGRLPGDVVIQRENFTLYLPISTMIVVSLLVSLIVWLTR